MFETRWRSIRAFPGIALVFVVLVALLLPASAFAAYRHVAFGQDYVRLPTEPQNKDNFGSTIAAGDFDGDGLGDLAIGSPGEGEGYEIWWEWNPYGGDINAWWLNLIPNFEQRRRGIVEVLYGSGVTHTFGLDNVYAGRCPIPHYLESEYDAEFGSALASGSFNGDAYDDLVITGGGLVIVVPGTKTGLLEPSPGYPSTLPDMSAEVLDEIDWWPTRPYPILDWDPTGATCQFPVFGRYLAVGDFNGDDLDDLAIGACVEGEASEWSPIGYVLGALGRGNVGRSERLFTPAIRFTHEEVFKLGWTWGDGYNPDVFPGPMASGDFDGDGYDDLAIGLPMASNHQGGDKCGVVSVTFGGPRGRERGAYVSLPVRAVCFSQASLGLGQAEGGDWFGCALAAGDFDGDAVDDLAIGASGENSDAGWVCLVYGSRESTWDAAGGLSAARKKGFFQSAAGGDSESNDAFGAALAAGDMDGDGFDDLAIGTPEENYDWNIDAGYVNLLFGDVGGLDVAGTLGKRTGFFQNAVGAGRENYDRFGQVLAIGDVDGSVVPTLGISGEELLCGVPAEDYGENDAGYAHVVAFSDAANARTLTFRAPSMSGYRSAGVYGYLRGADGVALEGRSVQIQYRSGDDWLNAGAPVTTTATGRFSRVVTPSTSTRYRAYFEGDDGHRRVVSGTRAVLPKARLTRSTSWSLLARYRTYYAKGYIEPKHSTSDTNKVRIRAYKKGSDGKYRYKKSFTASYSYYSSAKTRYTAKVLLTSRGSWRLVAYHAADSKNAATYGSPDYVTVK